jgi:hypothetical protein
LAKEIVAKAYFGRNENDLLMMEGPRLSQEEVTQRCLTFLEMHGLEKRYEIIWSSSFVSRATITEDKIKLRTNATFHRDSVIGLIYHEIGTHALRRINYEKQPWFKKKKQFGMTHSYLRTEEGLATLHALLPRNYVSAYSTALRYLAVDYAQSHSFSQLWKFLGPYIQDMETRWMVTLRQYRGAENTAQQAGASKDLVYFEGFVETWKWLSKNNWDLPSLYLGKTAFEDTDKAKEYNTLQNPLLPSFFVLDKDKYIKRMMEIGNHNQIAE